MVVVIVLGFGICSLGLQNGVEKVTKMMVSSLFVIILILAVRSVTLSGGEEGLSFYLIPNFDAITKYGLLEVVFAAMGQAFFALSLGIGAIAIFGSYIGKERRLLGETMSVCTLDTLVAIMSGLIIFPACFAFGVNPFGTGTYIQDLEDFFVTYNFLPLGSLAYLIFCTSRYGWGFDHFLAEVNTGKGLKFLKWTKFYLYLFKVIGHSLFNRKILKGIFLLYLLIHYTMQCII